MRNVVDLPAPLGPRKPVTTPGRTVNDKPSTAVTRPYRLTREWACNNTGFEECTIDTLHRVV